MYRAYMQAQASLNTAHLVEEKPDENDEYGDFDDSIRSVVKKVWCDIEKQCQDSENNQSDGNSDSRKVEMLDWNTVRVFVSSTFTDFFSEREVLVKKVFPELREWCQDLGLKLVECDLRWGIPKDTSTADTILVCLDEIERCRVTNRGQPFFINLVGERYGWIPTVGETPDEAREKYGWVEDSSITFMEIMHGAYRDKNPNAAFFMRSKTLLDDIPEAFHPRYEDTEPLARLHLKTMKKKIIKRFPYQVFPYSCQFKQISTASGREQVELTGLDEFAEKVITFLKSAIERMYPHSRPVESETSSENQEKDLQWLFALDKAKSLIGRKSELEILKEFVENGKSSNMEQTDGVNSSVRLSGDWDLQLSDKAVCVLEGASGWGKTALICKLIVDTVRSGAKVFFHIVNSSPTSNRVECLLRRLLLVLSPEAADDKDVIECDDIEKLKNLLRTGLAKYRDEETKLVVVLDGLNELQNSDLYSHLSWLPPTFPHNIHCIVSTNPHPPTTARIYEHPAFKMALQPMTAQDLTAVAVSYLHTFNKKLEPSQLESLVSKTGVDNPLWMMMMSEELRIFGDFRVLANKIDKLPNTMEGLLIHIIDRLIQEDDENEVIKKVLCLIACSRQGLPSDSILQICGDIDSKEELAPLYWARARRSLKPYLRVFGRTEEIITFSHEAVLKAVQNHLLTSQQEVARWHTVLADYYQFWCSDARTKVYNLPHHLEVARLKKRLLSFIREDGDSYIHINPWMRSHLVKTVRCRMQAVAGSISSVPMMLCHMCSMRSRGYNPACNWQNKRCCVLCGSLCMATKTYAAVACRQHAFKFGNRKCVLCGFLTNSSSVQAQICNHCSFGNGDRTCACFDV